MTTSWGFFLIFMGNLEMGRKRLTPINALLYKCPKCQNGDLYHKPFNISKPLDMHDQCTSCKQNFMPEPGFYYGAMFLSYILSSFLFLAIAGVCIIFFDWSVNGTFAFILFVGALSYLFVLRFSRSLWINIVVRFDPKTQNISND